MAAESLGTTYPPVQDADQFLHLIIHQFSFSQSPEQHNPGETLVDDFTVIYREFQSRHLTKIYSKKEPMPKIN
jgi:hypothetical protein